MKNAFLPVLCGLLLSLGACASNPKVNKQVEGVINTEMLIGEFGYWNRNCSNRHFDILIEEYPKGGDLRFEVGSLRIPDEPPVGSAGSCAGQPVQSKRIVYVPYANFAGSDFVRYVVKSSFFLGSKAYDVQIVVGQNTIDVKQGVNQNEQ